MRSILPSQVHARLKHWVRPEGDVQWCRVIMNREVDRFVCSLDHSHLDVLEISGDRFQNRFPFSSYRAVHFPEYDVCSEPLSDGICDVVFAEQVFEHVLRPGRAAQNVFKMLRPNGIFIVSTPFLLKVHGYPSDLYRWTEHGMRQLLEDTGFERVTTASWGNRKCIFRDMSPGLTWTMYNRFWHDLSNEPQFPIVIWAIAYKPAAEKADA